AVCGARRDHALSPQQRPARIVAQPEEDRHLRHPFGVRVGLSVGARRSDDRAPRPHRRRDQNRQRRPARRGIQDVGRLWRILPHGVGGAGAILFREGGPVTSTQNGKAPTTAAPGMKPAFRIWRILLPVLVAVSGTALWEAVVRVYEIPPYVLPAPSAVFATLFSDWDVLSQSLLTTLLTTLEGFVAAAVGGIALALLFNLSKLVEYSLFPYAVILQVTPVIAIAPLLLIYLPQQTAVIVCAWIVGFFPVLSNTTLGLNSVHRNLAGLFQLYPSSPSH